MTALDSLKEFIEQRLAAAVEEIFEYIEKTVTDYEKELDRYRQVLDVMLLPKVRLRREDVHSLTVKAKIAEEQKQQEIRPSLQQEVQHPQNVKEEQEGEQLHPLTEFPFLSVTLKSEDDEEKPQLPQLHQSKPDITDKDDLNRFNGGKMLEPVICTLCEKHFCSKSQLVIHERGHTREKPYCKSLQQSRGLKSHLRDHTGAKPFRCSDCGECFSHHAPLKQHMMCHKEEKAFSGSVCGRRFTQKSQIKTYERAGKTTNS